MTQIIINETTPIVVEVSTPGPQGSSGTATVGTVTTGAAGSAAAVTNSGTPSAAVFNFTIPKGDIGDVTPEATAAKNAAEAAAIAAAASELAAETAEQAAEDSATAALASSNSASSSAATATTKAQEATTSASNAAASAQSVSTAATTATTKAAEAAASATAALSSADTASTKAQEAADSATTANTKAQEAVVSATTATNKASEASASAATALSAQQVTTDNATLAIAQANIASAKAAAANTSANDALVQASVATAQAAEATTQATTATTQAGIATTQATAASSSATTAVNAANTATAQATVASTKASEASASASNSQASATAAATAQTSASASASTATAQATLAGTARTAAETARDAAVVAQNNAVAVVTGGTATLTPSAGKIPLADAQGKIAKGWLTNTDLVEQTDIGTAPNEIPLNQFLGELAYMDAQNIPTLGINVVNAATANVTNLMQVTEISNAVPSLNLDFAKVKQLDPRITFTRASTGTYYDGKTVAKAEENLLTYSEDFTNAVWIVDGTTKSANTTVAPDGATTADSVLETATTAFHGVYNSFTAVSGTAYTLAIYMKRLNNQYAQLTYGSTAFGAGQWATFDLISGTVSGSAGSTAAISPAGNGWYRCVFTATAAASGAAQGYIVCSNTATGRTPSYAGNTSNGVYVWGAQLEQRASATAYTPTTTQAVTTYIPVLQTAASGVPRFEHNPVTGESLGLEIEEQRTNLQTYSQDFSNATAWPNTGQLSSVETNLSVAPDGTITADKVIPNSGVTGYGVFSNIFTWAASAYTASVYLKAAGQTSAQILFSSSISSAFVNFDLSAGVLGTVSAGASGSIVSVGNGWYRCSVTITANAASGGWLVAPCVSPTSARGSGVTGNGFSGIYIWGAQLEAGAFPTSYIPTVASQVTRAADSAVMTGANFSSWYRQGQGTIFAEASSVSPEAGNFITSISQVGVSSNMVSLTMTSGKPSSLIITNAATQTLTSISSVTLQSNVAFKNSVAYSTNNAFVAGNGVGSALISTLLVPRVEQLNIGLNAVGLQHINGTIKKLTYYPQRLSNAELVEMTA